MRTIESLDQMQQLVGEEVAVSDWSEITQRQIDQFAEATGDHQWIHVDPTRARHESPFGEAIAHGFLTLALLPAVMQSALDIRGVKLAVNYGLNKVRFTAPVPAGSRVRARIKLLELRALPAPSDGSSLPGAQMTWHIAFEREGHDRPVCIAEWISRRYA